MVQDADRVDEVERFRTEGEVKDIGLYEGRVGSFAEVALSRLGRNREVDANHIGPVGRGHLGEASHAAADIENRLALQVCRGEAGLLGEGAARLGLVLLGPVELGLVEPVPLLAEAARVGVRVDKAQQPANPWRPQAAR